MSNNFYNDLLWSCTRFLPWNNETLVVAMVWYTMDSSIFIYIYNRGISLKRYEFHSRAWRCVLHETKFISSTFVIFARCSGFRYKKIWRYQRGNQNPYIKEEQTTQWPKDPKGVIRSRKWKKNRQHNGHKIPKG